MIVAVFKLCPRGTLDGEVPLKQIVLEIRMDIKVMTSLLTNQRLEW